MKNTTRQSITFILSITKSFKLSIFIALLTGFSWALDLCLRPYFLKIIIDHITIYKSKLNVIKIIIPGCFFLVSILIYESLLRFRGFFCDIKMYPKMRSIIFDYAIDNVIKQNFAYHQDNFTGSLVKKVNDLIDNIPLIIETIIDRFFSHSIAIILAIITLWTISIKFVIIIICWILIFVLAAFFCTKNLMDLTDKLYGIRSNITGKLSDILSNMISIKLFTKENEEGIKIKHEWKKAVTAEKNIEKYNFWIWLIFGYVFVIIQGLNLYILILGIKNNKISAGDFLLITSINISITEFLWDIIRDFSEFFKTFGKISQAMILLKPQKILSIDNKTDNIIVKKGKIVFQNVCFKYKNSQNIFNKLSLIIPPKQKLGIVGYTGSGKTTFISLILRFFNVNSGHILIDDQDISNFSIHSIRKNISVIPQNPTLFHRTISENIQYGNKKININQIISIIKKYKLENFINDLPQKYNTIVGEQGIKLSGGQRQLIVILRALLKESRILILDEATSNLDPITESFIQGYLDKLFLNKTIIVIAHRISTLLKMDRILVFDKGKVVQDGKHSDLVRQKGLYTNLWDSQIKGYLPN